MEISFKLRRTLSFIQLAPETELTAGRVGALWLVYDYTYDLTYLSYSVKKKGNMIFFRTQ